MRNFYLFTNRMLERKLVILLVFVLFVSGRCFSQGNVGLLATSAQSGGGVTGYGPQLYNDNIIQSYGIGGTYNWGWVSGGGWIEYTWTTTQKIGKVVFYKDDRPFTSMNIEYWNGTAYVSVLAGYTGTGSTVDSINFSSPVSTTKLRFNNVAGSNPNFREIQTVAAPSSNNNAGVLSIDSPTVFCTGAQNIRATIKNFGRNQITQVTVNWSLDGVLKTPINYSTLLDTFGMPNNSAQILLGSYSFPPGSTLIKVWTSLPNGVVDTLRNDDTASALRGPAIGGAYTINPLGGVTGTNFISFTAAAANLNVSGLCGPVVITVAPGTYNEQISLSNIPGSSATNTITFDGVDTTTRILSYSTGAGNTAVIELNGAKYITIKNLTIRNTSTNSASVTYYGVHLKNAANFNRILGCKITVSTTSPPYYYSVPLGICGTNYYDVGDNGSNNLMDGNRLIGGYCGMSIYGATTLPAMCSGNTISNNHIEGAWQYGININYQSNFTIDHNHIEMALAMTSSYGIYAYYLGTTNITRNIVNSSYYGIMFYTYSSYNPTGTCSVTNNMVRSAGSGTNFYGLYMNNSNNTTIAHNTILHTFSAGYALACYISDPNNKINNNIFKTTNPAATAMYVGNVSTSYFTSFDYNTLSIPAGGFNMAYFGGVTHASIAALKANNASFNQNNLDVDPVFASATNLHLSSAIEQSRGKAGVGITIDMDGDPRCTLTPSIGADESAFVSPPVVAGFTFGTVYVNSGVTFLNNYAANLPMGHKWYVDGIFVASTVNFSKVFTAVGTYAVKLWSSSCSGVDSITISVNVIAPTAVPQSDFISDRSVVSVSQNVNFIDLSSDGPTAWLWTLTPGIAGVDYIYTSGTSAFSQNPVIIFLSSGFYTVCMKASNSVGAGNTNCKTNYIDVRPAKSMCIFPFSSSSPSGNLYSSGGTGGGYSQNENCTFTIDACADSTYLQVTSASFGTASVDRFEIYKGDYFPGAVPLTTFYGNTAYNLPQTFAVKGKMTVREVTDATANNGTGIKANWYSTAGSFTAPYGTISGTSNVYYCGVGMYNYFSSTFRDPTYTYSWDFDNDGLTDFLGMDGYFSFAGLGPDTIKLVITGCGGTLNVSKFVNVIAAPVPVANFTSNLFTATGYDTVMLSDLSVGGVLTWKWTVTGTGPVNFVGGTNSTSRSPKLIMNTSGFYTVKLVVTNCAGADSMISSSTYIKILGFCIPSVGNLLPDMAITSFQMGTINMNITTPAPGTVAYRDFSQLASTNVDHGATYSFSLTRFSNYNSAGIKIWVDWNQDGVFSTTTELVASTIISGLTWNSSITVPSTSALGATRMRIGVTFNTQTNTPCGANIFGDYHDYRLNVRPDLSPPNLTLVGPNPAYVEIGRNFIESGDLAFDAVDGNVTDSIRYTGFITGRGYQLPISQQATALGLFTITATSGDLSHNDMVKTRTVIVTADTTKPVITLNGTNPMNVDIFTSFIDPGATATDLFFTSPITVNATNTVDTAHLGSYMVTYTATDVNGNIAVPVVRTVLVGDGVKPVIVFPPNTDTVYTEVKTTYLDPGATVTDNYYTGLTATWTGSVDTYTPGTYYYTFHATDGSGNNAIPRVRVIIVRDKTAPILILASPSDPDTLVLQAKAYTVVPEPGFVATDNYYSSSQITVSKSGFVDLNKIGIYSVIYIASDPANNASAPKRRIYKLVDTTKPIITMNGRASVNICRWRTYTDSGATVTDNYWNGLQVTSVSNLDLNFPGIYTVTYTAKDSSGNIATPQIRYINVLSEKSSSCIQFTGINNPIESHTLEVTPNPTTGKIVIDIAFASEKQNEIIIYNSLGQVVKSVDNALFMKAKYTVDLQNEAAGIYFVAVKSESNIYTKKFVINK